MGSKKIVVTEQSEEEPVVNGAPKPDEPDAKEVVGKEFTDNTVPKEPVTNEESSNVTELDPDQSGQDSKDRSVSQISAHEQRKSRTPFFLLRRILSPLKSIRPRGAIIFGLVIILALAGIYLFTRPTNSNPLPKAVKQKVNFALYYPASNSNGYKYLAGSSSFASGKLTYTLQPGGSTAGSPVIRVSEQALVGQGPDLNKLPNFSVFQAPAGKAAIGVSGNVINGVLVTKKTLVILNGLGGITSQELIQAINSMKS